MSSIITVGHKSSLCGSTIGLKDEIKKLGVRERLTEIYNSLKEGSEIVGWLGWGRSILELSNT